MYEVIKKDDRHKSLKLICSGEIPERCFSNWTIGLSKFKLEGFLGFLEKGFTDELINGHPSTAINLFQLFKELLPKEKNLNYWRFGFFGVLTHVTSELLFYSFCPLLFSLQPAHPPNRLFRESLRSRHENTPHGRDEK